MPRPKRDIPTRRGERNKRMDAPMWAYVSEDERDLCEWAAAMEGRSLSSWIADVCLEKAKQLAQMHNRIVAGAPTADRVLDSIREARAKKKLKADS
jgi:uncharacterized protein (DUF1778 family)